ncbi:MAG: guanylate kinase [Alphaproteobacteria bacterium]|nr:MAG: guanylate kinase [Alphaproteobacteria bacterium]
MASRRGLLIILSSPSGAGKSTLARRLREWDPSIRFSVSATTRPPRPGEVNGRDYWFLSREEFEAKVAAGEMLEHAEVFGHLYGTPRAPVEEAIAEGSDVLFDIDWQGGQQIRNSALGKHTLSIFILPPSIPELYRRLVARASDPPEVIARRMQKSRDEISHWPEYDYVLVNDDLDVTAGRLETIVTAERMRLSQQPGIVDIVRRLNAEFEEWQRTHADLRA